MNKTNTVRWHNKHNFPIHEMESRNRAAGFTWFDLHEHMNARWRFTKYTADIGPAVLFIGSESGLTPSDKLHGRRWSLIMFSKATGGIDIIGKFRYYKSRQKAMRAMYRLATLLTEDGFELVVSGIMWK